MRRFPLFLNLEGKKIYIAGAGRIALRRIYTLLEFGADIIVCAPSALIEVRRLADEGKVILLQECYREEHLEGIFFVLAATDSRSVNHDIYIACKKRGILVNTSDCREECDFYFPAIALSDRIVIGITGDGTDHTEVRETAAQVRRLLHEEK